jgi:tetratricopeptide (TPR) repeat protein
MKRSQHSATRPALLVAAVCLAAAGCASHPSKPSAAANPYAALYSGKSDLIYGTQLPPSSPQDAVSRGDAAAAKGDLDTALYEYIRALQVGGDNAETLYKIGAIHAVRGNDGLAGLAFKWALKADPKNTGALTGLGILLTKQRQYAAAQAKLDEAVQINPQLPLAQNALGVLADLQGNYREAQRHYEAALKVAGNVPEIWNNLGYSRYLSGNRKGAIAAFNQALQYNPRYVRAWRNLALVYARERKYTQALAALNKVEDMPKAYNDLGYLAMVNGRLKEAGNMFNDAVQLSPEYYPLAEANLKHLRTIEATGSVAKR